MRPLTLLGIACCLLGSGCATMWPRSTDEQVLAKCLREARADAPALLATMDELRSRTIADAVREGGGFIPLRLLEEHVILSNELAAMRTPLQSTWGPGAGTQPRDLADSEERMRSWVDIATVRFQVALMRFLLQRARDQAPNRR